MKNKTQFDKRKGRLIVVDGARWKWRVGNDYVVAYSENGSKLMKHIAEVKGMDFYEWDRARFKGSGSVTPREIADWIRKNTISP